MFLKNKNIIFKIRRSKVTDYAALRLSFVESADVRFSCLCNLTSVNQLSALEPAHVIFFTNASSIGSDQPA